LVGHDRLPPKTRRQIAPTGMTFFFPSFQARAEAGGKPLGASLKSAAFAGRPVAPPMEIPCRAAVARRTWEDVSASLITPMDAVERFVSAMPRITRFQGERQVLLDVIRRTQLVLCRASFLSASQLLPGLAGIRFSGVRHSGVRGWDNARSKPVCVDLRELSSI